MVVVVVAVIIVVVVLVIVAVLLCSVEVTVELIRVTALHCSDRDSRHVLTSAWG